MTKYREISTNDITKEALLILKAKGYNVWRHNQVKVPGRAFVGKRGCSDIIGHTPTGKFVVCEVKKRGDKLSEDQKQFLDEASRAGCLTFLAVQKGPDVELVSYDTNIANT